MIDTELLDTRSAEINLWLSQPVRAPYYFNPKYYQGVYLEFACKYVNVPKVVCTVNGKETIISNVTVQLYVSDKGYIEIVPNQEIGYNAVCTLSEFIFSVPTEHSHPTRVPHDLLITSSCNIEDMIYTWLNTSIDRNPHLYYTREVASEVFLRFNGTVVRFSENRRGILYVEPKGFIRVGKEYS